jgi:hypothetical protein
VSCAAKAPECVRDVSTGGVAVLKFLVVVSSATRLKLPLQEVLAPPVVLLEPLRLPLAVKCVTIFRTEEIGLQPATTAPAAL